MPVPSSIADLSTTPSSNSPAGSETPSSTDDYLRTLSAFIKQVHNAAQGGTLTWCGTAGGTANAITLTPSPAITAYAAGQVFRFKSGASANTGATTVAISGLAAIALQLNGAACVGGEILANKWYEVLLTSATNAQILASPANLIHTSGDESRAGKLTITGTLEVPDATLPNQAASFGQLDAAGQCRLSKSDANLVLSPFNGNKLLINGINNIIPSAGVTLAPTGLTPSTLYYIYAYMSSGVMTLEASATTHVTDTTTGVEIKSGDSTRTLVGMAYPITGPAWQDTQAQRFVSSYFNRTTVSSSSAFTASRSTASATYVELNAEIRNEFLIWSDDVAIISATGRVQGGANTICITSIGIDSVTAEDTYSVGQSYVANAAIPVAASIAKAGLSEGYHYATLLGESTAGTATWLGSASVGNRTVLSTVIQ